MEAALFYYDVLCDTLEDLRLSLTSVWLDVDMYVRTVDLSESLRKTIGSQPLAVQTVLAVLTSTLTLALCFHAYIRLTVKMCKSKASLRGKIALVTGANSGEY